MTFSIVARDPSTGALGMAVTSSSPCVGARCMHLRTRVGAVASQNVTDPRLGPTILDALASGSDAAGALASAMEGYDTARHRQVTVVDREGNVAHHSGAGTLGRNDVVVGDQVVAAGNLLSDRSVPNRMVESFTSATGELEERLLSGIQAGEKAGGEEGEVRSCGLAVVRDAGWRVTDLRVDDADRPLDELVRLLAVWLPQRDAYVTRGLKPDLAPSFGVPGDR